MNFTIYLVDSCLLSKMTIQKKLNGEFKIIAGYPNLKKYFENSENFFVDIILFNSNFKNVYDFELCKILKLKFPKSKLIVSFKTMDKEKFFTLTTCGIDGFVREDSPSEVFKRIAQTVIAQGFWANYGTMDEKYEKIRKEDNKFQTDPKEKPIGENTLTKREMEVLKLIAQGKSNTQIAREIIVSTNTAKAHVGKILSKLSVKDRVQAAVKAVRAHML